MATNEQDTWKELRKPFDPKVIGKLPRGGIQLDYVGHAAVTDRLLSVDPNWTWEPLALDERGLPATASGYLWIKLTVGGVTRLGVGDGKSPKEQIGDAIRNAAMRFGVALDLWTKDELESHLDHPELKNEKPSAQPAYASKKPDKPLVTPAASTAGPGLINPNSQIRMRELLSAKELTGFKAIEFAQFIIGKDAPESEAEVQQLIEALELK